MNALSPTLDLAPALVVLPGGKAGVCDGSGARGLNTAAARDLALEAPVIVVHASLTARRLDLSPPPRSPHIFDALELYAFVRPARFCAPSAAGLALALGWPEPKGIEAQAQTLRDACAALLAELAETPTPSREEALALAESMGRAGWAWAGPVINALRSKAVREGYRGSGLDVWSKLAEWEDEGPPGEPGSKPVSGASAASRLAELLQRSGLDEARPAQAEYATEAAYAFTPRDREGEPRMMLAEAGTGVGKTLGYLAPASLWSEANGPAVWVSTYTRALQRQIEAGEPFGLSRPGCAGPQGRRAQGPRELSVFAEPPGNGEHGHAGQCDVIGLALASRWARASRDGDMTGGDFPAWLPSLFAVGPTVAAGAANLVDRRGECVHAGCVNYKVCFIEKAVRASRRADLVIANHALVMSQAAFDGARAAKGSKGDVETTSPKRIVFDEGHHLFDAADGAFSAVLSGAEAAEMRRWIRGPEGRGRRGRGLEQRLSDIIGDREHAREALKTAMRAAAQLPGEGWSGRISPPSGEVTPLGPIEVFLTAALEQIRARSAPSDQGQECAARPALDRVRETAGEAARAISLIEAPLNALARHLEDVLDEEADTLAAGDRARIEGALRGLDRRARMMLPAWRSMLQAIDEDTDDDPDFVDWFESTFLYGRVVDASLRRHWVDPHRAAARRRHRPGSRGSGDQRHPGRSVDGRRLRARGDAHGCGASARAAQDPEARLAFRLRGPGPRLRGHRHRPDDPRQVAAAMRELFLAAGGGGLGLFTAIRRLRAVHDMIARPLAEAGLALYAQHVDGLEVGALVDIFRAEEDACLLGTDAIRDGVDVPGRSLRLLVFDRVPWPRPDLLHKARRARFGGKGYDDAIARGRIAQAFGRLIRRADDKGCFVMLDAAAPTRLFSSLPSGVQVERVGLVDAIEAVGAFLHKPAN